MIHHVTCAPKETLTVNETDVSFIMYGRRSDRDHGEVGASIVKRIEKLNLDPDLRAWDFLSIALAIVAADEACLRSKSADGWTRQIHLTVAVSDKNFWVTQSFNFSEALYFLTGDIWQVSFTEGGFLPDKPICNVSRPEELVCLLSGGMDSLIGAINLFCDNRSALMVSQVAKGDKTHQTTFSNTVMPESLHLQLNHHAIPPSSSERSQRARSICFLGYGIMAASSLDRYKNGERIDLLIPENGYISMNVPLTSLRLGSLSTRTTHPKYLKALQTILDSAGLNINLFNPYQFKTKGEMLIECKDQALLSRLIGTTTSCGRYARTAFTQCGRCIPCLVRRAAFYHWGQDPTSSYRYDDLSIPDSKHLHFDDVKSVLMAIEMVQTHGFEYWIGGAFNNLRGEDTKPYKAVVQRGLKELEVWLSSLGSV